MKFPELYLDWIEFLIKKKMYGAWIRDVSTYMHIINSATKYQGFSKPVRKSVFICKNIDYVINLFSNNNEVDVYSCAASLDYLIQFYNPYYSIINWRKLCVEFFDKRKRNTIASRKLSKKLYRANHKVSSGKHSFVEDTQPWYNKDYKNKKYNKNIWRR